MFNLSAETDRTVLFQISCYAFAVFIQLNDLLGVRDTYLSIVNLMAGNESEFVNRMQGDRRPSDPPLMIEAGNIAELKNELHRNYAYFMSMHGQYSEAIPVYLLTFAADQDNVDYLKALGRSLHSSYLLPYAHGAMNQALLLAGEDAWDKTCAEYVAQYQMRGVPCYKLTERSVANLLKMIKKQKRLVASRPSANSGEMGFGNIGTTFFNNYVELTIMVYF